MRCLVVDDSAAARRLVVDALRGIEVAEADGASAAFAACARGIDLVILDRNLPAIDGIELARRLRADPRTTRVPIVMMSTEGSRDELLAAGHGVVEAFLVVPFTPETLRRKIDQALALAACPA